MPTPKGYTLTQIALHWGVFLLVALQFILHDGISAAWRSLVREGTFEPSALVFGHIAGGILILVFVIWRMAIKAKRGAPALPAHEPAWMKATANGTHLALYALLILMAISGGMAWFGGQGWAAEVHDEFLKPAIILLVVLHVLGALYQQFVLKSDVMTRMGRPEA